VSGLAVAGVADDSAVLVESVYLPLATPRAHDAPPESSSVGFPSCEHYGIRP